MLGKPAKAWKTSEVALRSVRTSSAYSGSAARFIQLPRKRRVLYWILARSADGLSLCKRFTASCSVCELNKSGSKACAVDSAEDGDVGHTRMALTSVHSTVGTWVRAGKPFPYDSKCCVS